MKYNSNTRDSGYSLLELVIVVGIMSVVAASAVPSLVKTIPERRLNRGAWQVYMDLQSAKSRAVSSNIPVEVSVNNSRQEYTVWADENGNGLRETSEKTVRSLSQLRDVDLYSYPDRIVFLPTGTCELSSSFTHFLRMQVSVSSVGLKQVYVFPNGHIDPAGIQRHP